MPMKLYNMPENLPGIVHTILGTLLEATNQNTEDLFIIKKKKRCCWYKPRKVLKRREILSKGDILYDTENLLIIFIPPFNFPNIEEMDFSTFIDLVLVKMKGVIARRYIYPKKKSFIWKVHVKNRYIHSTI